MDTSSSYDQNNLMQLLSVVIFTLMPLVSIVYIFIYDHIILFGIGLIIISSVLIVSIVDNMQKRII